MSVQANLTIVPVQCPECRQEMLLHCCPPQPGSPSWGMSVDCPYCGEPVEPGVSSQILRVTRKPISPVR